MQNKFCRVVLSFFCVVAFSGAWAGNNAADAAESKTVKKATHRSNDDVAIDLVRKRPEVIEWLKLFKNRKKNEVGTPSFSVDHISGNVYSVQVFENMPDHTATFNWYDVNVKTGKVTKQF